MVETGGVIDCDVHNRWRSAREFLPYLEPTYQDFLLRGQGGGGDHLPLAGRAWLHPENYVRADAYGADGSLPGTDYELMREQLLDRYDLDYAILITEAYESSSLANVGYAAAIARAHNDWLVDTWLPLDPRLKGSMLVAPQDPRAAAEEIRRLGGHPDIVQVIVSSSAQRPYGDPYYHPIWDAANEIGLPVAAHLGATAGVNATPFACGPPTYYLEFRALLAQAGMTHVTSLIVQGVFEKFPNTRFVLVELGATWLPYTLWKLDTDWRSLRRETPWLRRRPSEYARDHIRLTTQPLEDPDDKGKLWAVLDAMHGREMLMFASDYPHWDFDDPTMVQLPPEWRDDVLDGNARRLYGLPSRAEAGPGRVTA